MRVCAGFTTSDFAIFGECLESLVKRGFGPQHVEHMAEPMSNYEYTLHAAADDLRLVFPHSVVPGASRRGDGLAGGQRGRLRRWWQH